MIIVTSSSEDEIIKVLFHVALLEFAEETHKSLPRFFGPTGRYINQLLKVG
jgi:hypothetical protein